MHVYGRQLHVLFVILSLVVVLAGCQSSTPPSGDAPSTPGMSVIITRTSCPTLIVSAGMTVSWTNRDRQTHMVHSESSSNGVHFDSGTLQPGESFTFNFPQPGSYTYRCGLDELPKGTITVQPS
jgi:hypothetical protein